MSKHPSTRCRTCGLHHGHVRHPDGTPPPPNGCRWCGIDRAEHRNRRTAAAGLHTWQAPTPAQVLARMHARRAARAESRRLAAVDTAFSRAAGLVGPAERRRRERAARSGCLTCEHFLPATAPEEPCNPDGCGCTGYPAACDVRAVPAGTVLPVVGCTRWEAASPAVDQRPAEPAPGHFRRACGEMNHNPVGTEVFCEIEDPDHDGDHDAGDGTTWERED
ncbi:hypothetical protein ACIP2X_18745 [Streptomyces sp. NPDC089424]|uniref:hypothetical protein n=1 Tax=Streptomyces sp. NPDC089424 TaxID=3365917 RepID=UPI0037F6CC46